MWFPCFCFIQNTNPKWLVIIAFLNSSRVVWSENTWWAFKVFVSKFFLLSAEGLKVMFPSFEISYTHVYQTRFSTFPYFHAVASPDLENRSCLSAAHTLVPLHKIFLSSYNSSSLWSIWLQRWTVKAAYLIIWNIKMADKTGGRQVTRYFNGFLLSWRWHRKVKKWGQ